MFSCLRECGSQTADARRFDELFYVDLPQQKEREEIWQIQITKYGRDPKEFAIVQFARECAKEFRNVIAALETALREDFKRAQIRLELGGDSPGDVCVPVESMTGNSMPCRT
jgi:SpoVK/Ycf46/Vps4 family AAA+-type ATPase